MGVRESHPSSLSMFRLERLSTMITSCPWSLRYREVGQPQKPSPPRTITFFLSPLAPFSAKSMLVLLVVLPRDKGRRDAVKADTTDTVDRKVKKIFMIDKI